MSHIRTQIRASLKTGLTGSPDAGARVFVRRSLPLAKGLEPTLIFSFQNERSADVSMAVSQERLLEVRITACAKGDAEETEDTLDRLGLFVEQVFANDPSLGGLISTYEYQSTEFGFTGETEMTLCTAAFTFLLTFYTSRDNPEN